MNTRLAVISDIHGNVWALKAVLAEIERRNILQVVNLGDTLYGPLAPVSTFELLKQFPITIFHISGNGDRVLVLPLDESKDPVTVQYTKGLLATEHIDWQ